MIDNVQPKKTELKSTTCVFTISARNYLSQVCVLFDSLRKECSGIEFYSFVVDGYDDISEVPELLRKNVFDCRNLGLSSFEDLSFKYDVIEFSTALKPYIFQYLFETGKYKRAIYFDPDIKLYSNLDWIAEKLTSKSILLTPHLLDPDSNKPGSSSKLPALDLKAYLYAGTYNLGFVAVNNDQPGKSFIELWAEMLKNQCLHDSTKALCVDQKWADFLSGFFHEYLEVSRDAGANLAYWNFHERSLTKDEGSYFVNGSKLKFLHYSSIDVNNEKGISPALNTKKIDLALYPEYRELFATYKKELLGYGYVQRKSNTPYRFNYFEDGSSISKLHRRLYARLIEDGEELFQPFSTTGKFYRLLKRKRLLEGKAVHEARKVSPVPPPSARVAVYTKRRWLELIFTFTLRLVGVKRYLVLLKELKRMTDLEENTFLLK